MSKARAQILEAIKEQTFKDNEVISAYVTAVDEEAATMDVIMYDGELEIFGVMLRGVVSDMTGIILVPEIGSDVVISCVDGQGEWVLVRASQLAKILIDVPELQIKCPTVVINEGSNKGLLILDQVKENLDQLKQYVTTLKSAIATGLNAVGSGGSASGSAGAGAFNGAMAGASITFKDMEDTKITH